MTSKKVQIFFLQSYTSDHFIICTRHKTAILKLTNQRYRLVQQQSVDCIHLIEPFIFYSFERGSTKHQLNKHLFLPNTQIKLVVFFARDYLLPVFTMNSCARAYYSCANTEIFLPFKFKKLQVQTIFFFGVTKNCFVRYFRR